MHGRSHLASPQYDGRPARHAPHWVTPRTELRWPGTETGISTPPCRRASPAVRRLLGPLARAAAAARGFDREPRLTPAGPAPCTRGSRCGPHPPYRPSAPIEAALAAAPWRVPERARWSCETHVCTGCAGSRAAGATRVVYVSYVVSVFVCSGLGVGFGAGGGGLGCCEGRWGSAG